MIILNTTDHAAFFGPFVQLGSEFKVVDATTGEDRTATKEIRAKKDIVTAPWFAAKKRQKVAKVLVVTKDMFNATMKDGSPCFEFQSKGWRPQSKEGALIVIDVAEIPKLQGKTPSDPGYWDIEADRWSLDSVQNFIDSKYVETGEFTPGGEPIWWKDPSAIKMQPAFLLPPGWKVTSIEGDKYPITTGHELLVFNKAVKGDFFIWLKDLVESPAVIAL